MSDTCVYRGTVLATRHSCLGLIFFLQKLTKIALVEIIIILVETHQHFILQGSQGYTFFVQCLI